MSKYKQLIIVCLLTLIVALVSFPEASAVAPNTKVRLEPAHSAVGLNETFTIQVMIEEAHNLGAFQFELAYDPSILQVKEVALGDFLASTGRSAVPIGPEVENEDGRTTFGAISFGDKPGPGGTGILATITWFARGQGNTMLDLLNVQVLDTVTNAQLVAVEGGRVVVGDAGKVTQAPAGATTAPTLTPATLPSPTPLITTPAPAPTGPSSWVVPGALLVALTVAILAVLVLRRRPEE
jgi:hypothetical protein